MLPKWVMVPEFGCQISEVLHFRDFRDCWWVCDRVTFPMLFYVENQVDKIEKSNFALDFLLCWSTFLRPFILEYINGLCDMQFDYYWYFE